MSYILDALRRADAERERDPARGIHAQPAAVQPDPTRTRVPGWAWPAGAVLVVAVATVMAWQRATPSTPAASLPMAQAPVAPVAAAVLPPAPPPPVVIERVVRVVPAAAPAMTIKAPPAAVAAHAPASAAAPMDRIYNVAELPADVQGALPKLAITGGVHSENPAQRMLLVGGQVMHEGAELAPGVVLEQIRPRGAVLKFRGYRYAVMY